MDNTAEEGHGKDRNKHEKGNKEGNGSIFGFDYGDEPCKLPGKREGMGL
ncbi:hypothetical protein I4300191C4_02160 [Solibaculum mannosilyticum]